MGNDVVVDVAGSAQIHEASKVIVQHVPLLFVIGHLGEPVNYFLKRRVNATAAAATAATGEVCTKTEVFFS